MQKQNGKGRIIFKQKQISYIGIFIEGKFNDKESANYECPQYTYNGHFLNGKKDGYGILMEKSKKKKDKNGDLMVEEKYEGYWKQDKLIKRIKN